MSSEQEHVVAATDTSAPAVEQAVDSIVNDSTDVDGAVDADEDAASGSGTCKKLLFRVAPIVILAIGGVLAVVCRGGQCSRSSSDDNADTQRAKELAVRAALITDFINNITLTGRVMKPSMITIKATESAHTPDVVEEQALQWLIEYDVATMLPDTVQNQFHMQQRYALQIMLGARTVYRNTTGHDECTWDEVSCNATMTLSDGTVVAAVTALSTQRWLPGYLSSDLGLLPNMVSFSMPNSKLKGSIPDTLGRWSNLEHFDVSTNELTGTALPAAVVENWTNLVQLDLSANKWRGDALSTNTISAATTWTKLQVFRVANSENLKMSSFFANDTVRNTSEPFWPNLKHFDIQYTSWFETTVGTLPAWVGTQWTNLVTFNADFVGFNGTLPTSIGNWTNLESFSVIGNNFRGSLPESIGSWTALTHLDVSFNKLAGSLPSAMLKWTSLQSATFKGNNKLVGIVPQGLCEAAVNLTLYLRDTQVNCTQACCSCRKKRLERE